MDGASSAATVLQIIQTAAEVTSVLTQYAISVKNAESSCQKLREDLELLSSAAEVVKVILESSSTQNTPHHVLIQQCFRDDSALMQSKKELDKLSLKLGKVNTKMKWTKKVKWPFKQKEINAAMQAFETYRSSLQMILDIDIAYTTKAIQDTQRDVKIIADHIRQDVQSVGLGLQEVGLDVQAVGRNVQEVGQDVSQGLKVVADALDDIAVEQERTKVEHINNAERERMKSILDWFKAVDCTVKHESTRNLRQSETCKWLFGVSSFVEWKECKTSFLWLNGIAGSGKSVLASAVIDHFESGLSEGMKLVYFYIEFRLLQTSSTLEVLRSLFVQLLRDVPINWLPLFDDLVKRMDRGSAPPADHDSLVDLLERAVKLHKHVVVVVDGLDECKDLPKLLAALTKLNDGRLQLFCSSRPEVIIKEAFSSLPSISLSTVEGPLLEDMRWHITVELEHRRNLKKLEVDQKQQIRQSLLEKAQGMFRWVECQLDRLDKCCSSSDVEHTLQSLPSTLYETYDRILDDIEEREFGSAAVRRVLLWLVAGQGEVGMRELSKVLKIDPTKPTLNAAIAPRHDELILEICGSFVRFDEEKKVVTLSHYTVQEYLTDPNALQRASNSPRAKYFISMPAAHLEITKLCMHYIVAYTNELDFVRVQYECPLLEYAVQDGPPHIANIPEDDYSIWPFLLTRQHIMTNRKLRAILNAYQVYECDFNFPHPVLRMIIRWGPLWLLRQYLDQYPIKSVDRDNPLTYAVEFGKVPQAQLLLDYGVDVNAEGAYRDASWTMLPVEAAAEKKNEELIKLFVAWGSHSPVDIGNYKPHVIRLLLQLGADVRPKGEWTVLRSFLDFSSNDDLETVKAIVEAGCVPELLPCQGGTLVIHAAAMGHFTVVEWLLDRGCQLPVDFLPRAIRHTLSSTTRMLVDWALQQGIAVDSESQTSDTGDNALHAWMAKSYDDSKEAVEALLDAGCDVNSQNTSRKTPLHLAVEHRDAPIVEYLIGRGAHVHANIVHSLLNISWLSNFESMLCVLMRAGMDVNEASRCLSSAGNTVLHALCWLRVQKIAQLGSPRKPGERFADDDDSLDEWHREQLSESPILRRARLLQEVGFDLTTLANIENDGFTALRIALDFKLPSPQIITHLIDLGEVFENVNYLPLENINWAADLPWYADAVAACRRATTSQSMTPHDIRHVRHILASLLNSPRCESCHIVECIMELAELWACTSIMHRDVGFGRDTTQVLSVPEFPSDARNPMVERVVFLYSGKYREGRAVEQQTGISRSIRHNGTTHEPFSDELELRRFSTDRCFYWIYHTTTEVFWDRRYPSVKRPNAFELAPGDALVLKRSAPEGAWWLPEAELELEFYRIDVYYSAS